MKQEKISRKTVGAVTATGILAFCGVLISTAMNVIFPVLSKEFQVDIAVIQWLTTIYFLVLAIIVPLSGFLKQSFKNKSLFLVAIGLFIAGIILNAFASSFVLLLIGRVVQGIGTGIALPLMFNIILEQVPSGKLGMMMGVGTMISCDWSDFWRLDRYALRLASNFHFPVAGFDWSIASRCVDN